MPAFLPRRVVLASHPEWPPALELAARLLLPATEGAGARSSYRIVVHDCATGTCWLIPPCLHQNRLNSFVVVLDWGRVSTVSAVGAGAEALN